MNAKDNPSKYPAIGRLLTWVDRPGSATKLFWALAGLCVFLFLLDFTYAKHGHFTMEDYPGFFGVFGFVAFSGVIFGAKALRVLIKQPEDFYGDKAIDTEDYPDDQLDKAEHDV